jgi:hypothetical protein
MRWQYPIICYDRFDKDEINGKVKPHLLIMIGLTAAKTQANLNQYRVVMQGWK